MHMLQMSIKKSWHIEIEASQYYTQLYPHSEMNVEMRTANPGTKDWKLDANQFWEYHLTRVRKEMPTKGLILQCNLTG